MNIIKPFRGITYNKKLIQDISKVLTPPYDIIDPAMQEELYNIHPYNFIRIDYGKRFDTDNEADNVYIRAQKYFQEWTKENIFIKDDIPTYYFLVQDFDLNLSYRKEHLTRTGFFGIYKLSDYSKETIMPHEKTQSAPKEDRYLLTKFCKAYFSGVFSIYEDKTFYIENLVEDILTKTEPYYSFIDYQGVKNYLYKISNEKINSLISEFIKNKSLYIADGHHRYETALRISKEFKYLNNEATDYTIMYFTNMCSPGIKILPTHRIIHNINLDILHFKDFLEKFFDVKDISTENIDLEIKELEKNKEKHAFIIVTKEKNYSITLKNSGSIKGYFPENCPDVLRKLDVNILYYSILNPYFKIAQEDLIMQKNISYEKDYRKVLKIVKDSKNSIGFILNPPDVEDIKNVANIGETMPQKSTFFYPKIPSGAVIYSFDGKNF